ncbi:MAG: laccase domain-containing protein [Chthoniobacterales bacterium]|nr:laccase domain-containing protein [Chthoniobacterales bacterium]
MHASAGFAESIVEFFPALHDLGIVNHAFVRRIPGIDVATERAVALTRLDAAHRALRGELGFGEDDFVTAEQVHSDKIATIDEPVRSDFCAPGADGLVTDQRGVSLGIYVADCCAVYLVDPVRRAIGLIHSGKKGTELAIVVRAIEQLHARFGSESANLVVQLSPCIRPPHYEVEFAAEIVRQARAAGVRQVYDSGECTACDLQRYYSYRAEKARTGRMLALLALT